jgi:hypothetical protein
MRRAIPLLPQHVFIAWCLVNHRDNFAFLPLPDMGLKELRLLSLFPSVPSLRLGKEIDSYQFLQTKNKFYIS